MLQNIKVADAKQSSTNVEGRTEGQAFNELVASIREKGVLVPVLARKLESGKWEVIAGNRRLAAAKKVGLQEIPAQIVEMTDIEAREAQIVENLQRKDVHPLDEGEAYRELHENNGQEIKSIAARVGKSEAYVRGRLFLTNLTDSARKEYRKGTFTDGHAVLFARLPHPSQIVALKWFKDELSGWNSSAPTISELKNYIDQEFGELLKNQPWLNDKKAAVAVGHCTDCPANTSTIFGDTKEGECVELKCHAKKMKRYISYQLGKYPGAVKITDRYSSDDKELLARGQYQTLSTKAKDHCDFAAKGIISEGENSGKVLDICFGQDCKEHSSEHSNYERTPEEKVRRKKEREKQQKAKEARAEKLNSALDKVKWPMTEKHLDALLALSLEQGGSNLYRSVAKRHALEVKKEKTSWGSTNWDYAGAVKKYAKDLDNTGKARLAFELLIDTGYESLKNGIGLL